MAGWRRLHSLLLFSLFVTAIGAFWFPPRSAFKSVERLPEPPLVSESKASTSSFGEEAEEAWPPPKNSKRFDATKLNCTKSGAVRCVPECSGSLYKCMFHHYVGKHEPFLMRKPRDFEAFMGDAIPNLMRHSSSYMEAMVEYEAWADKDGRPYKGKDLEAARDAGVELRWQHVQDMLNMSLPEVLAWWQARKSISVVDFPVEGLAPLPEVLAKYNGYPGSETASMIMSDYDSYTMLHIDRVKSGGSWMFLGTGHKHWLALPPEYSLHLPLRNIPGNTVLEDPPLEDELIPMVNKLYSEDLAGPMYVGEIGPGDFIIVPPAWPHKVYTSRQALGVGCYALLPGDLEYGYQQTPDHIKMHQD